MSIGNEVDILVFMISLLSLFSSPYAFLFSTGRLCGRLGWYG
jgi:hypothetical protein